MLHSAKCTALRRSLKSFNLLTFQTESGLSVARHKVQISERPNYSLCHSIRKLSCEFHNIQCYQVQTTNLSVAEVKIAF